MNKRKILVTGSLGQIGSELVAFLRHEYGNDNVVASDVEKKDVPSVINGGPFEKLDVLNAKKVSEVCDKHKVNTVIHLAAILSAVAEHNPQLAYEVNLTGLYNMLEIAREKKLSLFVPSSIAAFGRSAPANKTPQDTVQRPGSMYGVTKVAGELLCDYYFQRFGVDTRGVRFPGLISHEAMPGGGTTDYAVHIYYEALKNGSYKSFIKKGTKMDMMYMPDALKAVHKLLETDPKKLKHRNAFNITAMSLSPEMIAAAIKKHIPKFKIMYEADPVRQAIADSWPNSLDDSCAKKEWGWKPVYTLESMTADMLRRLSEKLDIPLPENTDSKKIKISTKGTGKGRGRPAGSTAKKPGRPKAEKAQSTEPKKTRGRPAGTAAKKPGRPKAEKVQSTEPKKRRGRPTGAKGKKAAQKE